MKIWMPYIEGGSGTDTWTRAMADGLKRVGINVVAQPFHRHFEFTPAVLSRVAAPSGTDIVLTNTWNGFAFRRPETQLVAVEHLCVFDPVLVPYKSVAQDLYHRWVVQRYVRASLHAADAVVAVSNYTAGVMSCAYRIAKPRTILNGIDIDFFSPRDEYPPSANDRPVRLLFVGNPSRRKGADLLTPIMERLGAGFELYYTAGLRSDALAAARIDTMHPLGRLSQNEVRAEYRKADLLLFPSRGEGLPLCVIESLACGTPVVATDVSSLPEAVTPDVGCLCPVDDVDAFADAVRELTADPGRLEVMSRAARARAEQVFDLRWMVDEYVALFEQRLNE